MGVLTDVDAVVLVCVGVELLAVNIPILCRFHGRILINPPHQHSRNNSKQELYRISNLHIIDNIFILQHILNSICLINLRLYEIYYQQIKQYAVHYQVEL